MRLPRSAVRADFWPFNFTSGSCQLFLILPHLSVPLKLPLHPLAGWQSRPGVAPHQPLTELFVCWMEHGISGHNGLPRKQIQVFHLDALHICVKTHALFHKSDVPPVTIQAPNSTRQQMEITTSCWSHLAFSPFFWLFSRGNPHFPSTSLHRITLCFPNCCRSSLATL